MYRFDEISQEVFGLPTEDHQTIIEHLLLDSRRSYSPATSLFFALRGPRRNGHLFIPELYKKAVRHFVISEPVDKHLYPEAYFITVPDTLVALQQVAAFHRRHFSIPVIGITGSNGKTIVKEWLYQLLQQDFQAVRSPRSYNSQIGVPLSVWPMNSHHQLGIFEAGISLPGEMDRLEQIILPTIGILTNLGDAHSEGFANEQAKLEEKLLLFKEADTIIYGSDNAVVDAAIKKSGKKCFSWGKSTGASLVVKAISKQATHSEITLNDQQADFTIQIPFTDNASVENAITCCAAMIIFEIDRAVITERMKQLLPVNMRLEMKKGINHCAVINDSYSADLSSLEMALGFLDQQSGLSRKTVILSDLLQSAVPDEQLYSSIVANLKKHKVERLIGIGTAISSSLHEMIAQPPIDLAVELYPSTAAYLEHFRSSQFREEAILVKGARIFGFEKIVQQLEQKAHQTLLEINLDAIVHNLKQYQQALQPATKVMAMVKAFAYGSGGAEIAGILQYHKVDYLGVAYADEGVELRRAGIQLPVMVMNPEENSFEALIYNNLEPEIYSFDLFNAFDKFLQQEGIQQYPIHIEIETGMNRLGFALEDMEKLGTMLVSTTSFSVKTVFSHLAASEEVAQDEFSQLQFDRFVRAAHQLRNKLNYSFDRHIANSAAILRHPSFHLDMVRLGIGMYGVDSSGTDKPGLQTVATLRTTVSQLKHLKPGESVSYNRKGMVERESVIATVRLGYADGYPRRLGNGAGQMYVNGKLAPVIGTVCMDMTMLDVTEIPGVKEGDDVIVFGAALPVQQLADWAGTIPYEIMTGISQRVKRVYYQE